MNLTLWKVIAILSPALFGFLFIAFLYKTFNPVVVVFTGIILLLAIIALKSPAYGLFTILFILPFIDFFKRALFLFDVTKTEYYLVKSLPDILPLILLIHLIGRRNSRLIESNLDKYILIFMIWVFLEAFNPRLTLLVGLGGIHLYIMPLLIYFYTKELCRNKGDLKVAFYIILATVSITSIYGLFQAYYGMTGFERACISSPMMSPVKEEMITLRGGFLRVFSTFTSHKEFGFSLVVAMLIIMFAPLRINLLIRISGLALMLGALIFTFHRASFITLLVGLFVFFLHAYRKRFLADTTSLAVLFSPLAVPTLGRILVESKLMFKNPFLNAMLHTGTFGGRVRGFERAFENLAEMIDPIGHGLGSVFVGKRIANIVSVIRVPHNGYLEMLWEIGSIGTFLFVLVVVSFFLNSSRLLRTDLSSTDRRLASLCIGILTGILLTHAIINAFTQMYHTAVYFWFFLGILSSVINRNMLQDTNQQIQESNPDPSADG